MCVCAVCEATEVGNKTIENARRRGEKMRGQGHKPQAIAPKIFNETFAREHETPSGNKI